MNPYRPFTQVNMTQYKKTFFVICSYHDLRRASQPYCVFFELPSIRQVDAGTFLFELHAERHPLIPQTDDRRCPSCAHVLLPIPIAVDGHGHDHIPYLMEMLPSIRQATTGICLF